jgi:chromosome partitioning protein
MTKQPKPLSGVIDIVDGPAASPETPPGTRILAFANFKGGVGKTTCAVNVAGCLAQQYNKKVLLVDLDVQSSLGQWLLGPEMWNKWTKLPKRTSYQIFLDIIQGSHVWDVETSTAKLEACPRLRISPATYDMFDLDIRLQHSLQKPIHPKPFQCLDIQIKKICGLFDYVIFDCPPNVYMTTQNALYCADYVIIPTVADFLSTAGLKKLIGHLKEQREQFLLYDHKPVQVAGIVINLFNRIKTGMEQAIEQVEGYIQSGTIRSSKVFLEGGGIFRTKTRNLSAISDAQDACLPISIAAPNSEASKDFIGLTDQIMEILGDDRQTRRS